MTNSDSLLPTIIQGGMGVAISNWRLARTVSRLGQLGVVSGTALDQVLARRLQDGDGAHRRRTQRASARRSRGQIDDGRNQDTCREGHAHGGACFH